jgi:MFS transporter, PPP family, 3-phenylpropionic acid transporter
MFSWPRWAGRFSPKQLLLGVFAVSALRWMVMGLTSNPAVLIASAGLHGITFGAFYLASVEWMSRRAPGSMRATGQALFTAATFGLGGIVGFRLAGRVYDALGGHRLFLVAAGLAVLPAVAIALTPQRPRE